MHTINLSFKTYIRQTIICFEVITWFPWIKKKSLRYHILRHTVWYKPFPTANKMKIYKVLNKTFYVTEHDSFTLYTAI